MFKDILEVLFQNAGKAVFILVVLMVTPMAMLITHDKFTRSDESLCLEKIQAFVIKLSQQEEKLEQALDKIQDLEEKDNLTSRQLDMCMDNCVESKKLVVK